MEKLNKVIEKIKGIDKKKRAYFIAIIATLFVMVWAFLSASIITSNFNRSQIEGAEDEQKVDAKGIIITETKEHKKYFEIFGETGHYSNDHSIATLNNVIGNFYKDNEVAMSFQATKGSYDENSGIITLTNNVFIVLKDNTSLKADKLTWYGSGKETVAEGNIVIQKEKDMQSLAQKGIIDSNYEKFKIIGKTQTKLWSKDKK